MRSELHVTVHGDGPRAVFVHGSTTWVPLPSPGSSHEPHHGRAEIVNDAPAALWRRAS